jgi:hypothetical protein
MSKKTIQSVLYSLVVVILLLASFFAGYLHNKQTAVQAQDIPGDGDRYTAGFDCNITEVAILGNRAHIKCANSVVVGTDTVRYFAIENTSANETLINRVMAIGLTNMSMNRYVYVHYETLSSSNPPGCLTGDCRKLYSVLGHK